MGTLFHVEQIDITSLSEVSGALPKAHLDAAFHVVFSACQNRAILLPDLICSALIMLGLFRSSRASLTG
jgi:hypothetical protein